MNDTIEVQSGSMVRMNVAHWFREPEFQSWYNRQLGKGLATWGPVNQPLIKVQLSASECLEYADHLRDLVLQSNVLAHNHPRVAQKRSILERLEHQFRTAADNNGLDGADVTEKDISDLTFVLAANVFFSTDSERASSDRARSIIEHIQEDLMLIRHNDSLDQADGCAFFVGVEPCCNGEGTDSDMPERYWDMVVKAARDARTGNEQTHIIVWISPA